MEGIGILFFVLFVFSSTATLVGLLWGLLAHGLWGHPAGPPPHLSPKEAREWTHLHPGGVGSSHRMSGARMYVALREHRWREVWPLTLVLWGIGASLLFLSLSLLFLLRSPVNGFIGILFTALYIASARYILGVER